MPGYQPCCAHNLLLAFAECASGAGWRVRWCGSRTSVVVDGGSGVCCCGDRLEGVSSVANIAPFFGKARFEPIQAGREIIFVVQDDP